LPNEFCTGLRDVRRTSPGDHPVARTFDAVVAGLQRRIADAEVQDATQRAVGQNPMPQFTWLNLRKNASACRDQDSSPTPC
jgi:hypothetical protein